MLVGILKPLNGKPNSMLEVHKKILEFNQIDYIELDINQPDFWEKVAGLDLFLYKITHEDNDHQLSKVIMPIIEKDLKVNCFPNHETWWHYDDKIRQFYLLKQYGFPYAECYVFWNREPALEWAETARYPVVFKLKGGAGSTNVRLIRNKTRAKRLILRMFRKGIMQHSFGFFDKFRIYNYDLKKIAKYFLKGYLNRLKGKDPHPFWQRHKNYVLFQKFMPDNQYDTRVTIVGDRAFAFKRFIRKNDFRASGSNDYDMNKDRMDLEMIKIAFEVSKKLGFRSMAYDFVYDENKKPVIVEISYTYGDYPEFSTGYWDRDLEWHPGRFWPEYLELVDSLNMPGLKQPEMKATSGYTKAKMKF